MLLKNKISVISGVGNRFGKAIAYLFAQEGSKIVLISRKSDIIHNIAQDINKQGGEAYSIVCDMTNGEEASKALLDGNIAYATAKSGVVGFTKNLARESREDNIRVNCILPGVIRNNFDKENLSTISKTIKRKGNSEDVAFAALFFASDRSSWITGQTIVVDGGEELFLEMVDKFSLSKLFLI